MQSNCTVCQHPKFPNEPTYAAIPSGVTGLLLPSIVLSRHYCASRSGRIALYVSLSSAV